MIRKVLGNLVLAPHSCMAFKFRFSFRCFDGDVCVVVGGGFEGGLFEGMGVREFMERVLVGGFLVHVVVEQFLFNVLGGLFDEGFPVVINNPRVVIDVLLQHLLVLLVHFPTRKILLELFQEIDTALFLDPLLVIHPV